MFVVFLLYWIEQILLFGIPSFFRLLLCVSMSHFLFSSLRQDGRKSESYATPQNHPNIFFREDYLTLFDFTKIFRRINMIFAKMQHFLFQPTLVEDTKTLHMLFSSSLCWQQLSNSCQSSQYKTFLPRPYSRYDWARRCSKPFLCSLSPSVITSVFLHDTS
jgi:hypothetical protein